LEVAGDEVRPDAPFIFNEGNIDGYAF